MLTYRLCHAANRLRGRDQLSVRYLLVSAGRTMTSLRAMTSPTPPRVANVWVPEAGVRSISPGARRWTSCTGPGRAARARACQHHWAAAVDLIRPDQRPGSSSRDHINRTGRKAGDPPPGVRQTRTEDASWRENDRRCAVGARAPASGSSFTPEPRPADRTMAVTADFASPPATQAQTSAATPQARRILTALLARRLPGPLRALVQGLGDRTSAVFCFWWLVVTLVVTRRSRCCSASRSCR